MAQFTLKWNNADILNNINVISQTIQYRYRLTGGAFTSTGFTPSNPLTKNIAIVDSPILDNNKVAQFRIETPCTINGPQYNDNGLMESIEFQAIVPTINGITENSVIASINLTNTDITKVKFTLKKTADNTTVNSTIVVGSGTVSSTFNGLTASTNYYFTIEFYATVNNIEVLSSNAGYIGTVFSPYPFTTATPNVCIPLTSITVTSIEVI